jgi:hypothetical protein
MRLPDLADTERMARIGRLSVLKSERRKCAEKLRDALIPIINNTGDHFSTEAARSALEDIDTLDALIKGESE